MDYVRLGASGLKVSRICLGCMSFGTKQDWNISEDDSRAVMRKAIEGGINFFDTANGYGHGESEEILGRGLREFTSHREDSVIATKVFFPMGPGPNDRGLSRKHILSSVEDSLNRLGTDYVDLLQIHRFDYDTPIEETLQALDDTVRAGKVRYIGASTMSAWQFAKMLWTAEKHGWARFVSMQNSYSLAYREEEREMVPLCLDQGVGLIPYSPLAGGFLTGNRKAGTVRSQMALQRMRYNRPADQAVVDALDAVAAARGVGSAQIALAWLLTRPAMTAPIVGITKLAQLDDALASVDLVLTPEETAALEAPYVTQEPFPHRPPAVAAPNLPKQRV
jgi:aryl-alcohol dehydrogenase-like predicted oxidoreductase